MFIVFELQTNNGTTSVLPAVTKQTLNEAESVYYQILSYAAVSNVERHAAMVVNEDGIVFNQKCFYHGVEAE